MGSCLGLEFALEGSGLGVSGFARQRFFSVSGFGGVDKCWGLGAGV